MTYEVEQKFRLADVDVVCRRVQALGGEFAAAVHQEDRYFNHPARDLGGTDEALRLRSIGRQHFITYKGPKIDQTTKTRREIELELGEGPMTARQAVDMLTALGFREVRTVKKSRRTAQLDWRGRKFHVDLDQIEGLGTFVEIETLAESPQIESARDDLAGLAQELGLSDSERRSYLEMILEQDSSRM